MVVKIDTNFIYINTDTMPTDVYGTFYGFIQDTIIIELIVIKH